jgi:heat shock protein HslJ
MDPAQLIGATWRLTSRNGQAALTTWVTTLTFTADSFRADTPCYSASGGYTADGDMLRVGGAFSGVKPECAQREINPEEVGTLEPIGKMSSYSLVGDRLTISTFTGETLVFERSG